ncbi:PIF1-like helicase domain-containing protein [Phthorimaea operculella]|nr:PIF1-like helicase domain-containing protein [Phthorimaea operculella]
MSNSGLLSCYGVGNESLAGQSSKRADASSNKQCKQIAFWKTSEVSLLKAVTKMEASKFYEAEENDFQPKRKRTLREMFSRDEKDISDGETSEEVENSQDETDQDSQEEDSEASEDEISEEGVDSEDDINSATEEFDEDNIQFGRDQERIFTYVKKLLEDKKFRKENPNIIFINGAAGTGKTELLKGICKYVRSKLHCQVVCTASTGVTALKYNEGRTGHSMFGFPFNINIDTKYCEINDFDQQVSDFLELGPIVPNMNDNLLHLFSIKSCSLFNQDNTKYFMLKTAYRTKKDEDYFDYLVDVGFNNFPPTLRDGMRCVPLTDIKYSTSINEMVDYIYPPRILSNPDVCAKRAILTTTKSRAQEINAMITENKITTTLKSIDYSDIGEFVEGLKELDESNENKVFPDACLELWKGCVCMVIQTMYQPSRYHYEALLTGTKVIVEDIQPDIIYVRRPGGKWTIPIERKSFPVPGAGRRGGASVHRVAFKGERGLRCSDKRYIDVPCG